MKIRNHIKLLLLIACLAYQFILVAQPGLEDKYWIYRERLLNEFMIGVGPNTGYSIPATARDTMSGSLWWTDCTIEHGQYIGVLATEYKLLSLEGKETDETVRELFYALYALNRLDYFAEDYFGGTRSLNGFFIRDDVDEDSLNMQEVLQHLNQGLPEPKITFLRSDLMAINPRDKEESLDQAILLITGLGLVTRCIPEDVMFMENNTPVPFQDFETSLNREAKNQINRIVNYIKEGDSTIVHPDTTDPNLYGIQGNQWDFIIKNPVTYENVMRGENAYLLSTGFAGAKFHFTGESSESTDTARKELALQTFLYLEDFTLPSTEDFKVINLDAMANVWPAGIQPDTSFTEYNALVLGPRSQEIDYGWIPMLHQMVFRGNNYLMSALPPDTTFYNDPKGYYEYLLNLAPAEGPFNYNDSIYPNFEWSSTSRTIHPERRGETATAFPGNYNGIDFMLFYNLYRLLFSPPVRLQEKTVIEVNIHPNPTSGKARVLIPEPLIIMKADAISLTGRKVYEIAGNATNSLTMDLGGLPPGTYVIRIFSINNHLITRKIIVQ